MKRAVLRYYLRKKLCDKCNSHLMGLSKKKIKRNRREVTRTTERRRMMKIFPSDPLIITLTFNRLRAYISCRQNIQFLTNSFPLDRQKFHLSQNNDWVLLFSYCDVIRCCQEQSNAKARTDLTEENYSLVKFAISRGSRIRQDIPIPCDMVWWASIVLTTAALVQTSSTDTIGRYFT